VIRVANAPCSWGVLEFEAPQALRHSSGQAGAPASQVLDEMAAAGYAGTELGDWGFLPTEPAALAKEVAQRKLVLVGGFVPIALAREDALEEGMDRAVKTARLMKAATGSDPDFGSDPSFTAVGQHTTATMGLQESDPQSGSDPATVLAAPVVVLSDDNATVPHRTARAGRIRPEDGLTNAEWDGFAARATRVAAEVRDATGVRTVFHHHCAGYVETPQEIEALMSRTPPDLLGLCLDTGHLTYGRGNAVDAIARYRDRIWHVHFKDCDPELAQRARGDGWDYHTAVRHGIFCELGKGMVPFRQVLDALRVEYYDGWIVVEQDVLPGLGTPAASASRNRQYLARLGL
jgi:inosose dehydratase